jgi:hypothetical protein
MTNCNYFAKLNRKILDLSQFVAKKSKNKQFLNENMFNVTFIH